MSMHRVSDHELVETARRGDQGAFCELVVRYRRQCLRVALSYVRNQDDAEDQVQSALLKVYRNLEQYRGEAEFSTWLCRIVANECLMFLRRRRRVEFLHLDEVAPEARSAHFQLPAGGPDPECQLASRQWTEVVRREVRRIPPLLREVVVLRDLHGRPLQDVADHLGITVAATKSRLLRARSELRQRMTSRHCRPSRPTAA